jgi:hypothetical protein
MGILWKSQKKNTGDKKYTGPDNQGSDPAGFEARYFTLDKGGPGDSKTLVKYDGCYWRWSPLDKKWSDDQTITKEDWGCGNMRSIPKEEAEKILNS